MARSNEAMCVAPPRYVLGCRVYGLEGIMCFKPLENTSQAICKPMLGHGRHTNGSLMQGVGLLIHSILVMVFTTPYIMVWTPQNG
jgi:hypothetical protein